MHVAVVTSSYPRFAGDAGGHFVLAEVGELLQAGHDVSVLAPGDRVLALPGVRHACFGAERAFGWPGVLARLRGRPLNAVDLAAAMIRARRRLRSLRNVDRVIAHWIVPCGWPIAAACDAPLEIVAHGSDVRLLLSLPSSMRRRLIGGLLERGARFRFVSHELRRALGEAGCEELFERSWVEPCRVAVPELPDRDAVRAELGLAPDRRLAVVVARLVASKRVEVALGAADLVPGLETIVIGDGPERPMLERRFRKVRFVGAVSRPHALRWMRAADLVLSASRHEGAPTAIREARALGVPVVTAPCGDVARWAEHDQELFVIGS